MRPQDFVNDSTSEQTRKQSNTNDTEPVAAPEGQGKRHCSCRNPGGLLRQQSWLLEPSGQLTKNLKSSGKRNSQLQVWVNSLLLIGSPTASVLKPMVAKVGLMAASLADNLCNKNWLYRSKCLSWYLLYPQHQNRACTEQELSNVILDENLFINLSICIT